MSEQTEPERQHRIRRRHGKRRESPSPATVPRQTEPGAKPGQGGDPDNAHQPAGRDAERGMRALIGAGPSQISREVAMRTRDAAQPTEAELAEAERDTEVVRRNWQPHT